MPIIRAAVSAVRARWKAAAFLAATAVIAAVAGVASAQASIPDSNGTIHGCYRSTTGELRVIDTGGGGSCLSDETALSWPQSGLQYFTGTETVNGDSNGEVSFSETCPDNGMPVSIWVNGGYSVLNFSYNRQVPSISLVYGSSGPVGLHVSGAVLAPPNSQAQISYELICS